MSPYFIGRGLKPQWGCTTWDLSQANIGRAAFELTASNRHLMIVANKRVARGCARREKAANARWRKRRINNQCASCHDAEIDAEVSAGIIADGMMFFGRVSNGRAKLRIDRLTGGAAYAVELLPRGTEIDTGTCHEVAPPATKF